MRLWNRHTVPKDIEPTYIGRGTPWGNPFKVGEGYDQDGAADAYRKHLARALAGRNKKAVEAVMALQSVEHISCSCKPKKCHGDCFVEIFDIAKDKDVKLPVAIREWVKLNGFPYGPETDGKDHINMYSKAKTKLGKKLTNMSNMPVHIEGAGQFMSMEGYWYWLSTGRQYSEFLDFNGFEAKMFGRSKERIFPENFKDLIRIALWKRFEQNPSVKEMLVKSTLPFAHYYHYGDADETVTYPPFDWITEEIELLRKLYRGELKACIIAGSRDITDMALVEQAIKDSGFEIDIVVCGGARGVDALGAQWGEANGRIIRNFPAEWDTLGKRAGFVRNKEMGDYATYGIVLIKDGSKGSTQMSKYLTSLGKQPYTKEV